MLSTRSILWAATLLSAFVFLAMTVDSLHQLETRTHAGQISAEVVEGKWLWQHYDCNDCHTILGIGGSPAHSRLESPLPNHNPKLFP